MENDNRPHFKEGPVKYTKGYGRHLAVSRIIMLIVLLIALIIGGTNVYIYINQPVKTNEGFLMADTTQRTLNINEEIIIVETDKYDMFTPLRRFVSNQNTYSGKIIAGPYGEIKQQGDRTTIIHADKTVSVNLAKSDKQYLDMEYVIEILNSNDNIEEHKIVNQDEILGLKLNEIDANKQNQKISKK